jgi:hypothetical protein
MAEAKEGFLLLLREQERSVWCKSEGGAHFAHS